MASTSFLLALAACMGLASCSTVGLLDVCARFSWPDGVYPHPNDCDMFIQCSNNITAEVDCPNGTVFNPIKRLCDDPMAVPMCLPAGIDVTDACNLYTWANGIHYHPYDCTKFIECTYGRTDILPCAPGLYFNPALLTCDRAGTNPYCAQYVTPAPGQPTQPNYPAGWDTYCSDKNLLTGIHVDPFSCLHFIECTFGRTTHMACPAGTAFNGQLMVCDDNMNVNCKVMVPSSN